MFTAGDGTLWVIADSKGRNLYRFDKQNLLKEDPGRRLPDTISPDELSAAVAGWTPHQQAICRFFWGDDAAAVKLLLSDGKDALDSESLYLLARAYDANGLNQPDQANAYAEQLRREYPGGLLARQFPAATPSQPSSPSAANPPGSPSTVLRPEGGSRVPGGGSRPPGRRRP
jgi:hypothetical protein